jgi:cell division protein FtsW
MIKSKDNKLEDRHSLAIIVFALAIFGLVVLSSASAIIAHRNFGSNDFYFWKQFRHLLVSIFAWILFYNIPYQNYKKIAPVLYIASVISLILVFVPGIGAEYGTAHSWINLPLMPSVQPAEYCKLTLIIYIAFLCSRKGSIIKNFRDGLLPIAISVGIMVSLIIIQPDYGTSLIIVLTIFTIVFVAGASKWHLVTGFALTLALASIVATKKEYIYYRFVTFLDPFSDRLGKGYHIIQSLIAVGSGGFWGKGFGNSRQKFEYIPEAQGDSIFAIASEELGFVRVLFIIILFLLFAFLGYKIASNTHDKFGKYLATGITSWIIFQALINIMVVISLFPTTGVPLPFISYGGTSLLSNFIAVGILMNISKNANNNTKNTKVRNVNNIIKTPKSNLYQRKKW